MTGRDHLNIVCRDCGEVSHHALAGLRPGAMVSCSACGLVIGPTPFRGPAFTLGSLARGGAPSPPAGAGAAARPGPKPRRAPGRAVRP